MTRLIQWWNCGLTIALGVVFVLIGVGRLELGSGAGSISAWSVSRTTFFFWLMLKIALLARERRLPRLAVPYGELAPLWIFFLVVSVSLLPDFRDAGDYRYFAFACAHGVMVADVLADGRWLRTILFTIGVTPGVLVVRGLVHDPAVLSFDLAHRFAFPLDHANTAGFVLALTIPLALWCVETAGGWRRALAAISCVLQLMALLLTYSRVAWVGAAVSLVAYAMLSRRWKPLIAVGLALTIAVFAVPALRDRIRSLSDPLRDASISERLMLFDAALRVGLDRPILGVGYGRGRVKAALRDRLRGTPDENMPLLHTHNVYTELFAGTGLLGLGAFVWLLLAALTRSMRSAFQWPNSQAALGVALTSAWIALMVCGLGDVPFFHHETRILLFTLFALIVTHCAAGKPSITAASRATEITPGGSEIFGR